MNREERIERLAREIFIVLYFDKGWGEATAWNEAYHRAEEQINSTAL